MSPSHNPDHSQKSSLSAGSFSNSLSSYRPGDGQELNSTAPGRLQALFGKPQVDQRAGQFVKLNLLADLSDKDPRTLDEIIKEQLGDAAELCIARDISCLLIVAEESKLPPGKRLDFASLRAQGIEVRFCSAGRNHTSALASLEDALHEILPTEIKESNSFSAFRLFTRGAVHGPDVVLVKIVEDFSRWSSSESQRVAFSEEVRMLGATFKKEGLLVMLPAAELPAEAVHMINSELNSSGVVHVMYQPAPKSESPKMSLPGLAIYCRHDAAVDALAKKLLRPRILPPQDGWQIFTRPRYIEKYNLFEVAMQTRDWGQGKFENELKALASVPGARIHLRTAQLSLNLPMIRDFTRYLHKPLEYSKGKLVIQNDSAETVSSLYKLYTGISIVKNDQEAYEHLCLHYPLVPPAGYWSMISNPRRYRAESDILCCELGNRKSLTRTKAPNIKAFRRDLEAIAESHADGLIVDTLSGFTPDFLQNVLLQGRELSIRGLDIALVCNSSELRNQISLGSRRQYVAIHKTVHEAFLDLEFGISPGEAGWQTVYIKALDKEANTLTATPAEDELLDLLNLGVVPQEFMAELRKLKDCSRELILNLEEVAPPICNALVQDLTTLNGQFQRAGKFLIILHPDRHMLLRKGFQNVYKSLSHAINEKRNWRA